MLLRSIQFRWESQVRLREPFCSVTPGEAAARVWPLHRKPIVPRCPGPTTSVMLSPQTKQSSWPLKHHSFRQARQA